MSARAVAVIRPAPIIIALPLFPCTLSGKRQLHACRYRSACPSLDYFGMADNPRVRCGSSVRAKWAIVASSPICELFRYLVVPINLAFNLF